MVRRASLKITALLAGALLGVTACSASGSGTGSSAKSTTSGPSSVSGTLRLLVPSYPASTAGKADLQKVVDTFHKDYPNVTVEPDFATFSTLNQKIATSIAGGTPYDVLVTGVGWIPPFASQGAYVDLAKYGVTTDTLGKTTVPALISAGVYNGKVYGVPLIAGPKPLALRKSMFVAAGLDPTKPPTTLAEIEADAKKLTKTDSSGKVTQAGFDFWAGTGGYRQDFVALLGALGQPLYKDGKPAFNGSEGKQALQWISDMINKDKVIAYAQQSASKAPMVTTGEAAMGFTGGYVDCSDAGVKQAVCDDLVYFNLKDSQEAMFSGGQLASISAKSKLPDAAWSFIQDMQSAQSEADIATLNFAVPASSAAGSAQVVTSNPASTFSYAHLSASVFEGGATNWLDLRGKFDTELDQAILGQKSVDAVLSDLAQQSK